MKPSLIVILVRFSLSVLLVGCLGFGWLSFNAGSEVMVDGITISAVIVTVLSVIFSVVTWFLFSWATKSISSKGIMISVITGVVLITPFTVVLGPMAAVLIGLVAGFAAYTIQKKINSAANKPLAVGVAVIAASYVILFAIVVSVQPTTHIWDTGSGVGVGAWTTKDDLTTSKINTNCMTIKQSKQIASFFKTPTYLLEGYSHVCSRSGTPSESYIVYYYQEFPNNWQIHELISNGAIFIYQVDEKNMVGDKEFQTYGSPEQRIQETYDEVMKKNPSLNPQLITINGMLAYAVDSCNNCGIQTANFTDGTVIQKSTSSETRIKFIDENGVSYMLETTLPLSELIKVAESLQ